MASPASGDDSASTHLQFTWRKVVIHLLRRVRALVLGALLVLTSGLVGVFGYRIAQLERATAYSVVSTLFEGSLSPMCDLVGAATGSIIVALVFYPRPCSGAPRASMSDGTASEGTVAKGTMRSPRSLRFVAGIIAAATIDVALFDLPPQQLTALRIVVTPYRDILYTEAIAAFVALLLTPLYRRFAPRTVLPKPRVSPFMLNLLGWADLILVSLANAMFVVYLSTHSLPQHLNSPEIASIILGSKAITLTAPLLGAFISAIAVASVAYWPPRSRRVACHFMVARILTFWACVISVGLVYRTSGTPEAFVDTIMVAGAAMLFLTPVQFVVS